MVSPDSQAIACPLSGRNSTYRPVQISGAGSMLYEQLCAAAHSRPDASDGEMWRSNGPVYVSAAVDLTFKVQVSTYAVCYLLAKIGRPALVVPASSERLFTTPTLLTNEDIARCYTAFHVP